MPLPSTTAERHGDELVLENRDRKAFALNPTAALIWRMSDASTSAGEIATALADHYRLSEQYTLNNVIATLNELERHGFVFVRHKLSCDGPVILNTHWIGRFGNRMHQYAYAAQYAQLHGAAHWTVSEWEGSRLFQNKLHELVPDEALRLDLIEAGRLEQRTMNVLEEHAMRTGWQFEHLDPTLPDQAWRGPAVVAFDNLCAYETHIFEGLDRRYLLDKVFVFSEEVKRMDLYKRLEDEQGTYDIAHLRRGDLANVEYKSILNSVVSKKSYLRAFKKAGVDPSEVRWVTDDTSGNWGAGKAEEPFGWTYPEGAYYRAGPKFDWLADFLKLYFARTVFRSNSSFSFWACFLMQQRETPARVFAPRLDRCVPYWTEEADEQGTDFEFEEGNHPHWMSRPGTPAPDIVIRDWQRRYERETQSRQPAVRQPTDDGIGSTIVASRSNATEMTGNELVGLLAKENPVILDVGCNDGHHTRWFLSLFKAASVYAFEPDERAIHKFEEKVRSERAHLFKIAISNVDGPVNFYHSGGDHPDPGDPAAYETYYQQGWDLSGSIRKPKEHLESFPWVTFDGPRPVMSKKLDTWCREQELDRIDLIWADVQGAEVDLIMGGKSTLERTRFLYTEYSESELYEGQIDLAGILDLLPNFELLKTYHADALLRNTRIS